MTWAANVSVRSIAEVALGRQRSPQHAEGPFMVKYLRAANVKDGRLDLSDVMSMNFTPDEQRIFGLKQGDVLVTEGSGSLTSVGASAVWRAENSEPVCFQNTLLRLRPRAGVTDGRFLGWWARSAFGSGLFASLADGANIYHLSAERVRAIRIDLPPLNEQRRIADFLDAETARIDGLIEAQRRVTHLLRERRNVGAIAHITGLTEPKRRTSRLAWTDSLPAGWPEVRLGLVARMGSGHTPSRSHPEWWTDCTIPWITTGEVSQVRDDRREVITETRERISALGLANSAAELHPPGTVVLCRTASAGYSAVMGASMATSQDFVTWTCGPRLNPFYLLWCLRAMRQDLLGRLAMGSTHKTIYVPDLQMLRIPLPGLHEQEQIVERIREENARIDQLIDAVHRQLQLLAERRQALITAAVTGQIDVTTARGVDVS
ncbi:restriction endonuclease subunit S [Micromonospora sp. WMMD1102]|uniref:restriction endonuclease subunit S n=1 Tax=Micromonospora sp. WMMD1102 TaxID=3016105 RepID=UPI0024158811|nr:restriction endonuclease subunit S [Micromonospora sp. WMMD1102]MDG4789216.1 restriction endonuclease subunit S [Micromonospora sp. WMMD1102]